MIRRLRTWLATLGAPPAIGPSTQAPIAPLPSDPVNDSNGINEMARQIRREKLLNDFVAHHNAFVVRDFGEGPTVLVDRTHIKHLSDVEIAGLVNEFAESAEIQDHFQTTDKRAAGFIDRRLDFTTPLPPADPNAKLTPRRPGRTERGGVILAQDP